jgi:hypothetical protein
VVIKYMYHTCKKTNLSILMVMVSWEPIPIYIVLKTSKNWSNKHIWNCGFFVAIYCWKQNKKLKVNEFQIFLINEYTTHILIRENAKLDIFKKSSISLGWNVPHRIPYDGTSAIIDSIVL